MNVTKKDAKNLECGFCKPGEFQAKLDKVAQNRGLAAEGKKIERDKLKEEYRVIATCDKPVVNDPWVYKECHHAMCEKHVGSEPVSGHHRCVNHGV